METPAYLCLLSASSFAVSRAPFPQYTSKDESNALCCPVQILRTEHPLEGPPQHSLPPDIGILADERKQLSLRMSRARRSSEEKLQERRRTLLNQRRLPKEILGISTALDFEKISATNTSWMMIWTHRSNPHSPTRLAITPTTNPNAAIEGVCMTQKKPNAPTRHKICQLMNHRPPRNGPTLLIAIGTSHVAEISTAVDTVLRKPICADERPTERRYVTIWPEKERTVK